MDCKYLEMGIINKAPSWICKKEFVGNNNEAITDKPVSEIICKRCRWYERDDEPQSSGGGGCQEEMF